MHQLDPARTIIALGNYGYDWTDGKKEADEVTCQKALITADESKAKVLFDSESRSPYFEYDESDESHHRVWFLDAVTAYNQMRAASGYKPAGYAVWRLGSEDPSIWSILGGYQVHSPDVLQRIVYGYDVDFEGTGEILKVMSRPQDGWRNLDVDPASGFIKSEDFVKIPSSYVIERSGDHPGLIALTFDDGPDPEWTPDILDILKREHVPATFFIIGKNGQTYPDLMRRIVNEGHEIGNHTFTHPNLGEIPVSLTELELNATQRLIESETGRSTVLFRPPYFGDAEADKPQEVEPALLAQQMGYLMVGVRIDPDDWKLPVTAEEIIERTIQRASDNNSETRGQVVLLHDSGGDRSATIEALPRLIHELRSRGFRFVPVSELAGLSRDQVMPLIPASERAFTRADSITFFFLSTGGWTLQWIFVIGIVLGLGRLLQALPVPVVEPPVIEAAQAALLESAEREVDASVRAEPADQSVATVGRAEQDEVLPEQPDRLDRPLLGHLGDQRDRLPVRPEQTAAGRAGPGPGDQLVVLARQHPRPPPLEPLATTYRTDGHGQRFWHRPQPSGTSRCEVAEYG